MPLTAGTRIGPYEILSAIGAGGMGEVYRARDTKLGRQLALKVLPVDVSMDAGRRDRFELEARSASALNHPNIVTIYEIGRVDSTSYIAMELVSGRTLRDLLAEGALPIRRFLALAAQIADGLARAHEAGIVHRDLKPENVMVTRDGAAKILDFGLAKLVAAAGSDISERATVASQTRPGLVLGTVGYMSPEQASGKPVDCVRTSSPWERCCTRWPPPGGHSHAAPARRPLRRSFATSRNRSNRWSRSFQSPCDG
ncbi:MAG: serine/threonine protein kinase [Acidobacteria bacterium]|nr:serine/threonine protein kinase [Acidobacteriota bacterium]